MLLNEKDIKKIGKLARIKIDDKEVDHFCNELSSILKWIEMLQEVDTSNVEQMTSVSKMKLPKRKDEANDGNIQEDVLANAPNNKYGCFVVPKVVE